MHDIIDNALNRITPTMAANVSLANASMFSKLKQVDIMGIISDSKLIGEIRFLEIITYLYSHRTSEKKLKDVLDIPVTKLINKNINRIYIHDDLDKILQKIKDSKSGNVFVMDSDDSLCGYISLPDLVPWALRNIPPSSTINDYFSYENLVFAYPTDTMGSIVELMLNHRTRRVVIKGDPLKIIDDRDLKNLFGDYSYSNKTMNSFFMHPIKNLAKKVMRVDSSSQMQDLARLTQDGVDCFVTEKNRMITPWDIVMTAYDLVQKSKS